MSRAPKVTYYVRVKSNLTGKILTNWDFFDESIWYFGKCNLSGGESENILEFDIWNNQPEFNAGMYDAHDTTALACMLSIQPYDNQDLSLFKLGQPFLYGRCFSTNIREEWEPITISSPLTKVYGNRPTKRGMLFGNGDHMLLQTKLIIPNNNILQNYVRYPFKIIFSYRYDNEEHLLSNLSYIP